MIRSPESMDTALKTVKGQRRMTAHLRRLELITEIGFLTSYAVMLCGWLVVSPGWQPLIRALMPLGLSTTAMRKPWPFVVVMVLMEMAAIPLFPGGVQWDVLFVLSVLPVTLVSSWAYRTRRKAAIRWLGTVIAVALSRYLIARAYYPYPIHTLMLASIRSLLWVQAALHLNFGTAWSIQYWCLGFMLNQVFWATGIFLVLAFFAELEDLSIAQVPFFGRWKLPSWCLWIFFADLIALVGGNFWHRGSVPLAEVAIVGMAAYAVVGANVLWRIAELSGVPKIYRVALLGLWAASSWLGLVLLSLLGIYESIWYLRDYALSLRRL